MKRMSFFNQSILIGNLKIKNRVFLAPLAGVSDVPFRRICQELGAGLTYVEMLSATAIAYQNKRTFEMMARHKNEDVLGVQVTGPSAVQVAHAVSVLDKQGFETIDINMGCPVRKVVGAGCGSAILKEPERITETVLSSKAETRLPLSAKYRLGYTRENMNVRETTQRVIQAKVDMFTIHGRTRSESYSTPCDLQGIALAMNAAQNLSQNVVRVGNGDIFSYESALKMQLNTKCDAVMVSRGALGNPWIFKEIISANVISPTFEEWLDVVMRHLSYQEEHYGKTKLSGILARKHLLWYTKGFPSSKFVRDSLNRIENLDQAREILKDFATRVPNDYVRFSSNNSEITSCYDPKFEMDRNLDRGVGDEGMGA
jgi:tRNA-dihydrouridine synthase B